MLARLSSGKWVHSASTRPQLRYILRRIARRAAGVISGKAISRFLSAIGRLGRSKFIAHPPSRAPARTARSNGIARSAAVTAVMPVYSMRALTVPICLAIRIEDGLTEQRLASVAQKERDGTSLS